MFSSRWLTSPILASLILAALLPASCSPSPGTCLPSASEDLSQAAAWAAHDGLPFRLPLDGFSDDAPPAYTYFGAASEGPVSAREYHAAEDFLRPAGTPVYAMADGRVSFSGPMGGYGWLIIVDHPQANLYSLYGHLSPSRPRLRRGQVKKGELLAYLGDEHENGGSLAHPLVPHLHLGVRAGQRADYSGTGEWRWQAGWIKPCPPDAGWLQPSAVITSQNIPAGGYPGPALAFLAVWGIELLLVSVYLLSAACMCVFALRKNKPVLLVLWGSALCVAGWYLQRKGMLSSYALFAAGILVLALAIYRFARRGAHAPPAST